MSHLYKLAVVTYLHCQDCTRALECTCGTWDYRHESHCEINSEQCFECFERHEHEANCLDDGDAHDDRDPGPKELSLAEIDALVAQQDQAT